MCKYTGAVPSGESVLNFGAGPTIHAVISASAKFRNIVFAEYTEANKTELKKWIADSQDKFDWSRFFKYVAVLEGLRLSSYIASCIMHACISYYIMDNDAYKLSNCSESKWNILEQRVRRAIKDVVHCDATNDPIVECPNTTFDAIIITLCLEEACTTLEGLKTTVKKLAAIMKPGGHFIIFSVLEETYYRVGDQMIKVTPFTEEQVLEAITDCGLSLKEEYRYRRHSHNSERVISADYSTMLGIMAQK